MKKLLIITSLITLFCLNLSAQATIAAKDAAKHIGETVTICDRVYSTKLLSTSNLTFLDLGGYHPNQLLTLVIKGQDRARFKGTPEEDYKGRAICVTGVLVNFKGKPEIILTSPAQLTIDFKDKAIRQRQRMTNPPGN